MNRSSYGVCLCHICVPHTCGDEPPVYQSFHDLESLRLAGFNYSHVVVGSDQVWRPSYSTDSLLIYFLAFINEDIKKVSYAASFGNDYWDLGEEETQALILEMKKFEAVSVREKSGVEICKNIFSIDAAHVLDPTLLIGREFFDSIIGSGKTESQGDIVFYKLDIGNEFEEFIGNISQQLGLSTKNIYYSSNGQTKTYYKVKDWLSYIKNSTLVVTDSFHCVCFAILFEKPFLYYPNESRGLTRLESLLTQLELGQHLYRHDIDPIKLIPSILDVDYSLVNKKLDKLRAISSKFLSDSLRA